MQKTGNRPLRPSGSHVKSPAHLSKRWKNAQLIRIDEVYADQAYDSPEDIQILANLPLVRITYHAISIAPGRMRYRYIMEGYDEDWIETWDEEARYSYLPIGTYTFKVVVADDGQVYSEKAAELKLDVIADPRDQVINELEEKVKERTRELTKVNSELKEKTSELLRSNQELDSFVYTVSHDLKAPLISLNAFSNLLMKEYENLLDENGKMYIQRIRKNSEYMEILIGDLLELSRIGRIKRQAEMVDIQELILEVSEKLDPQFRKRKIATKLIVKGNMPVIFCDSIRVNQIFTNLISNANKFMDEDCSNPTIELGYEDKSEYHAFYVRDNGIGIEKEHHEKIFQTFQRLNDIKAEGTGVGLSIVKKIVEALGGKIWVESEKGSGTTMHFTLAKSAEK